MRSPLRPRQLPLCSIRLLAHAYSEARPGDLIHQISGNKTSARSPPSCRAAECASYPLYALSAARVNAGGALTPSSRITGHRHTSLYSAGSRRVLTRVTRAGWRLEQAERERVRALVSAGAEGVSIRKLATAAGLSPSRMHKVRGRTPPGCSGRGARCGIAPRYFAAGRSFGSPGLFHIHTSPPASEAHRTHRVRARTRRQPPAGTKAHLKAAKERSLPSQRVNAESRTASSALAQARRRVGVKPLTALSGLLAGPAAGSVRWRGLLVCAIDGTTMSVPDSAQNVAVYGRQAGTHGGSGYPLLRLLAVVACGTRTVIGAVFGPVSIGETSYAPRGLTPP